MYGNLGSGTPSYDIIANNTIINWGSSDAMEHGIYIGVSENVTIYNNIISTTATGSVASGAAILVKAHNMNVYNNTITLPAGGKQMAFSIYNQGDAPVNFQCIDNTITTGDSSDNFGILLGGWGGWEGNYTNMLFQNDTFNGNFGYGDVLIMNEGSGVPPVTNTTFIGCHFNSGHIAVQVGFTGATENINNVTITDCYFTNMNGAGSHGRTAPIYINSYAVNTIIKNSVFSNCAGAGYPVISSDSDSTLVYNNTGLNTGTHPFYVLNVTVVGNGTTSPSGLGWQYASGTSVSITWTPSTGYARQNISIDGTNQNTTISPVNVNMTRDHVVIAYFV